MKQLSVLLLIAGIGLMPTFRVHAMNPPSHPFNSGRIMSSLPGKDYHSNEYFHVDVTVPGNAALPFQTGTDRKQKAREALLPLLRGVFNTRWKDLEVMLTIDAGWRNDSLSIEYKYYKGNNLMILSDDSLVETIYFTVDPEEVDAIDTEQDEFWFLYLRNKKKKLNVHHQVSRPSKGVNGVSWCSSFGIPVRPENLPQIIQLLKEIRSKD